MCIETLRLNVFNGELINLALKNANETHLCFVIVQLGNEAGHFKLKEDTSANRLAATPPPDIVYTYTNLPGVNVPFVGMCSSSFINEIP